jgi:hypothetical protein
MSEALVGRLADRLDPPLSDSLRTALRAVLEH